MEREKIDKKIRALIIYSDYIERTDFPHEFKMEKLEKIESEKMFLQNIIDENNFKEFLREFIISMSLLIVVFFILLFMILYYGN